MVEWIVYMLFSQVLPPMMPNLKRTAQKKEKGIYISASEVISRFSNQREGHKTAPYTDHMLPAE